MLLPLDFIAEVNCIELALDWHKQGSGSPTLPCGSWKSPLFLQAFLSPILCLPTLAMYGNPLAVVLLSSSQAVLIGGD